LLLYLDNGKLQNKFFPINDLGFKYFIPLEGKNSCWASFASAPTLGCKTSLALTRPNILWLPYTGLPNFPFFQISGPLPTPCPSTEE